MKIAKTKTGVYFADTGLAVFVVLCFVSLCLVWHGVRSHFEFSPPTTSKLSLRRQECMIMVPSTLKDLTFNVGH